MGCANSQEITYLATAPLGASQGQTIAVPLNGSQVLVNIPSGVSPGQVFRFRASDIIGNAPVQQQFQQQVQQFNAAGPALQSNQFRVVVPQNISPGQHFDVTAPNGQRLRVECPPRVYAGQVFIAQMPAPGPAPVQQQPRPAEEQYAYNPSTFPPNKSPSGTMMVSGFSSSSAPPREVVAEIYDPSRYTGGVAPIEVAAVPVSAAAVGAAGAISYNHSSAPAGSSVSSTGGGKQYQVVVPPGVRGGQNFEVSAGGQRMMVQCPPNAGPGSTITIQAPASAATTAASAPSPQSVTQQPGFSSPTTGPTAVSGGPPVGQMDITVPPGVEPGQTFEITSNGTRIGIKCPPNTRPGQKIRIQIPSNSSNIPHAPPPLSATTNSGPSAPSSSASGPQTYQVQIPPGVFYGSSFEVQVGGKRAKVECPAGATAGQMITISV